MKKIILISFIILSFLFTAQAFSFYDDYEDELSNSKDILETSKPAEPEEEITTEDRLKQTVSRADLSLEDIYYYNKERNKVYPEISTKKVVVVFDNEVQKKHINQLLEKNKNLIGAYIQEDHPFNLKTMVVFELNNEQPRPEAAIYNVINVLNTFNEMFLTHFVSPVFIIDGKEFIFKGEFEMRLKNNPSERVKHALLNAEFSMLIPNSKDPYLKRCLISSGETKLNYFQIMNQFAEDFEVVYATPIFRALKGYVHVRQTVELDGAKLGKRIPYTMVVTRDQNVTIDPSSLTSLVLMPPSELFSQSLDSYNVADVVKGTKLVIKGYIQFFSPGDYTIPKKEVAYITENGETMIAKSNELNIRIASLIPDKSTVGIIATAPVDEYTTQVDIKNMSNVQKLRLVGIVGFVIAVFILLLLPLVGWWKSSRLPEAVNPVPGALEGLKAALQSDKKGKEYFSHANKGIRNLLNALTGTDFSSGAVESVKTKLESDGMEILAGKSFTALKVCEKALSKKDINSSMKDELSSAVEDLISTLNK